MILHILFTDCFKIEHVMKCGIYSFRRTLIRIRVVSKSIFEFQMLRSLLEITQKVFIAHLFGQ